MPYSIDKYNGTTIAVVEDGTIDSTLDIKLIGKNYAGYGEVQNENFVHLLENFAGGSAPPRPIGGQIWYDTTTKKIKFWDAASARWRTAGGAESTAGPTGPIGLGQGDFWFETVNKQLYVYDGSAYVLVGPQGIGGLGTTQMKSVLVTDTTNGEHGIIQALVDGDIVFVVSTDSFTLSTASATTMPGFGIIKSGITLASTNNNDGVTDVDVDLNPLDTVWGTVSNSLKLNGFTSDDFIKQGGSGIDFSALVHFSDLGYTVGDSDDLQVKIDADGITPIFRTSINNTIKFQTYNALTPTVPNTPLTLVGANILPGTDNVTDLGSSSFKFKDVYGTTFSGTAAQSDKLKVVGTTYADAAVASTADTVVVRTAAGAINATSFLGNASTATTATTATQANSLQVGAGVYRTASVSSPDSGDANTIAVRDSDGDLCATIFRGTATAALFADLAEKYLADDEYEVGTVVTVGGEQEVTACQMGDRAFGAVSGSPAFMMNEGLVGGTYIALKGRVPVKVIGAVVKGDKLIAASNGCAGPARVLLQNLPVRAGNFPDTFAIALESSDDEGVKLIEAIII
jgi:hypothetical protein